MCTENPESKDTEPSVRNRGVAASCCVLYRRPGCTTYVRIVRHTAPMLLSSVSEIPTSGGYVIAPFAVSSACPVIFIEPDSLAESPLPDECESLMMSAACGESLNRADYARAFSLVSQQLQSGRVRKVVLSRAFSVRLPEHLSVADIEHLFFNACRLRPNSFVSLWTTPVSGTWLVASPEPLLEKRGDEWRTVALAGTMPCAESQSTKWSSKNREEQALVARFIHNELQGCAEYIRQSAPHTLVAGNIQHICTEFRFRLNDSQRAVSLLNRLHPTPAVCGVPRREAYSVICSAESIPRNYYAGFSGPFCLEGSTHLYVSLRCMELGKTTARLYAGGGIMPESLEQDEWEETERKMQTMLQLINGGETNVL